MADQASKLRAGSNSQRVKDTVISMKSTAASLTLALLGFFAISGCHQATQRAASIAASLPASGTQSEDFETRLGIARTLERQGKTKDARKQYQRLLKEDQSNSIVHHRLGVIAASNGDYDEANLNFKRSMDLSPGNAELIADWGYSLFLQGELAEAEELTRQGAELAPHDARIANNLRLIYEQAPMIMPVSEQVALLRPSDQSGLVVAEAFDEAAAVVLPAGLEMIPPSFEMIPLPLPAAETTTAPSTENVTPASLTAEPALLVKGTVNLQEPVSTQPTVNVFASSTTSLKEPVAIQPATAESDAVEPGTVERPVIGSEHVHKLLTRARLELAAGDVQMSHAFAEAAAEIPIPLQLFQQRPEKVLDEIEFVTNHNNVMSLENPALTTTAFAQPVLPAPAAFEDTASTSNVSAISRLDEAAASDPQGFRAIGRTSLSIFPKLVDSDGERRLLPERRAYRKLSQVPVIKHTVGYNRDWTPLSYSWEAPQLKYNPLYFEDAQLERYGNEVCILQPFLSGARFYATLPTLPYQMMSEGNSPCHTVYDLGHDQPGNCVPYALEVPPFSWTGGLASGGWAFALIVILP
jgi:tetratricopeptide (TPR) repeat protein